ncbi:hypothetical protein EUTSA_v10024126mg [Eutrema salsugineum]|uniref:Pentacotripeptide-repeat region of PRORP domain-containing protein n=1 Tax=Eutrema salsugineum TaxID=72664 RepID=V4MEA9_EUTSA|nr:hypothetical protein EUTSA_v10024126mg [Eutrema salsugineum]
MGSLGYVENVNTFNLVIYSCCKEYKLLEALDLAGKIRIDMVESGVGCNERTYGSLVDTYGRARRSDEALRLCDEMTSNGLLAIPLSIPLLFIGCSWKVTQKQLCRCWCKEMRIDRFTHFIVVRGLCRNGYVEEAVKFQRQILEKKLVEYGVCQNTLMHHLVRDKKLASADQILGSMLVCGLNLDAISFGTLIDGHLKEGKLERAIDIYDGIIKMKQKLNLVVYNSIVNGLSKRGLVDVAEATVKAMESKDAVTYNTLLNESLKNGNVEESLNILSKMQKPGGANFVSLVTYNILINHLCKFGSYEKAKKVLKIMVQRRVIPDHVTYGTLITSFSKQRDQEEVIELHDYIVLNGVTPHEQIYVSIVRPLLDGESGKRP